MAYEFIIKRDTDAKLELIEAYTRLFTGKGVLSDAQKVYVDLMSFTGYFNVSKEGEDLSRFEGKRSVGGRIFSFVNMADYERDALYQASRQSSIVDQIVNEI